MILPATLKPKMKKKNKKPTNLKPMQDPNVVRSGSVDYDYYVNETVTCLKSGRYFQKRCNPGYLVTRKVPKYTHTHTLHCIISIFIVITVAWSIVPQVNVGVM